MVDNGTWLFFYTDFQCQIRFDFRIGRFLGFDVRNSHDWTLRIASNIYVGGNVRFRRGAARLDGRRSRNSDLQATIGQRVRRTIGRTDVRGYEPAIIRAMVDLHRLVVLSSL